MNKIFKVKRNASGQSVVTSELARSKSVITKAILCVFPFLAANAALADVAMNNSSNNYALTTGKTTTTGSLYGEHTAVGEDSKVVSLVNKNDDNSFQALTESERIEATKRFKSMIHNGKAYTGAIALGTNASALVFGTKNSDNNAGTAIAIGTNTVAAASGISLGAEATSYSGVAIGSGSTAIKGVSVGAGARTENYAASALGHSASVSGAVKGTAVGSAANVSGENGVSLGYQAQTSGTNSVAVGADSLANKDNTVSFGRDEPLVRVYTDRYEQVSNPNYISDPQDPNYGMPGTTEQFVMEHFTDVQVLNYIPTDEEIQTNNYTHVDVVATPFTRKLTNITDGAVEKDSTDAVTGGQLFTVKAIADNASTKADEAKSVAEQAQTIANGLSTKVDEAKATAEQAQTVANGALTKADEAKSVAEQAQTTANGLSTKVDEAKELGESNATQLAQLDAQKVDRTEFSHLVNTAADVNVDAWKEKLGISDAVLNLNDIAETISAEVNIVGGENVKVERIDNDFTISVEDANTQATVSADKGITITETNNANGTKNYAVSAKLGKGLKVDENGAIAATAQSINGGAGVSITTNAQDEAVVNVAGVTTTTDDGKSYTRSDVTKPVSVKGDGKNIRTSTAANGDVQINLADDMKVNSVTTGNVSISTKGVNAGGKKVTHVAPAEISSTSTDAVNGSQLYAINQQVINNTQNINRLGEQVINLGNSVNNLDNRVSKVEQKVHRMDKRRKAGTASSIATAGLLQPHKAGQSGITAAVGQYQGQTVIAVGYSRLSDNGKVGVKLSLNANTEKEVGGTVGIGYFW